MGFAIIAFLATLLVDIGISAQEQIVLAVLFLTMILWFSEVLPLHVTALISTFLLIVVGGFAPKEMINSYFDPVIMLLLGGFVLALGMQKHKLDEYLTNSISARLGHDPKKFLFGVMCLTAFMSFWMSNTASTAVILPIALLILAKNGLKPLKSNFGKSLILGVAFAATIGGIGTLVGSTPNPIAVKFLADQGIAVSFLDWMFYGMPIVVIMLPVAWFVLTRMFKPEIGALKTDIKQMSLTKKQKMVLGVFAVTVMLWLTSNIHGVSASVVSMVPIILLYLFGLLETEDISKISWASLLLFGGGLALGTAIGLSGLDMRMAEMLTQGVIGQPLFLVFLTIVIFGIALTVVASNTAAAAISVPIILPVAAILGIDLRVLAILIAIAVSLDFIVPVGTPPSTIAYSSGYISIKDMAKSGVIIAAIGSIVLSVVALFFW